MSVESRGLVPELSSRRRRTYLTLRGRRDSLSGGSPPVLLRILPRGNACHSVGNLCDRSSSPTKWPYSTEKFVAKGSPHRILMASIFLRAPRSIITHCG